MMIQQQFLSFNQLTLEFHLKERVTLPGSILIQRGSVTTDGQYVFITPIGSNSVFSYELDTGKWNELPLCPYENAGLVFANGELIAVGGRDVTHITNKMFTLHENKWVEHYHPMTNIRSSPAVLLTPDRSYIIVIGGHSSKWTTAVELFQLKNKEWLTLTNLPNPLPSPSAAIVGDLLYVVGQNGLGYSCSVQVLLLPNEQTMLWEPLPCLPVKNSTIAALCGRLVAVGGTHYGSSVNTVYQLILNEKWKEIGSMNIAKTWCLVSGVLPDKIIIVGGSGDEDFVEECTAK